MSQGIYKNVSRKFYESLQKVQGCFKEVEKGVSRKFQEFSRTFQGNFKGISRMFQVCFKCYKKVSRVFKIEGYFNGVLSGF